MIEVAIKLMCCARVELWLEVRIVTTFIGQTWA